MLLSSASPCSTSWRRAPSSESISSEDGEVERISRSVRATASGSIAAGVGRRAAARDCVSEPAILCTDVSIASAPSVQRVRRQLAVEAEVRAPGLVDDQRDAGGVRDLRAALDVGRHPVVGGGDDERGARVRAWRRAPRVERLRRDAVRHAELGLVLRRRPTSAGRRRARGRRSPTRARCAARRPARRAARARGRARGCPASRRWSETTSARRRRPRRRAARRARRASATGRGRRRGCPAGCRA